MALITRSAPDATADPRPILRSDKISFVVSDLFVAEELTEILQHGVVHLEVLADVTIQQVVLGEVEERVVLQQIILEAVWFRTRDLHVRSDATTAINSAATIRELYFLSHGRRLLIVMVVIVVVERDAIVVTLDQPPTRRVVLGRGQR